MLECNEAAIFLWLLISARARGSSVLASGVMLGKGFPSEAARRTKLSPFSS
jgi:hypothetical protein